ncbi:hypothetical protein AB0E08_17735 [Streptomyces sp. NPDC048281]|uniref:hypothetical protein n=1 Tax=Streptomyces sp. NPDC048281 TaxID=3154715 RepID=UPI003440DCD7
MLMLDSKGISMIIQFVESLPTDCGGADNTTGSVGSCGGMTLAGRWNMIRDIRASSKRVVASP